MSADNWTVWCGGVEVIDHYTTEHDAKEIAAFYRANGYDDTHAEKISACNCGQLDPLPWTHGDGCPTWEYRAEEWRTQ